MEGIVKRVLVVFSSVLLVVLGALSFASVSQASTKVRVAAGATDHSLSYQMRRLIRPGARVAHQYEWGPSPWGLHPPERPLDCIDMALRDDPPICRSYDRYSGYSCNMFGCVLLHGYWPARSSEPLSSTYRHTSVGDETLGFLLGLREDCQARTGWGWTTVRPLSTNVGTRASATETWNVILIAPNGVGADGQPFLGACVYSATFYGPDTVMGFTTPFYHGIHYWNP